MNHVCAVIHSARAAGWLRATFRLCCGLFIFFQMSGPLHAQVRQFGTDIPVHWYADATGKMTVDEFIALPASALTTAQRIPSFGYSSKAYWLKASLPATYFSGEQRWLKLGPSFIDHFSVFYRPSAQGGPWIKKEFGDRSSARESDLNYRESVLILPPPLAATGYEVVFRIQSSSTLLLLSTLSSPQEFLQSATRDTAFWSFYFGLAVIASGVALWLAVLLRRRLLWGICLFSLNYPLVAALHGYPEWFFGNAILRVQDAMISYLSLLSYATALWLHSEVFDLKNNMPRLYRLLIAAIGLNMLLLASIPLNFYGLAMQIEAGIFFVAAPVLLVTSWALWRRKAIDWNTFLLGLLPPTYVVATALVLLSLHGIIPFHNAIYSIWQYALIVHIIAVLVIAVLRIRAENRRLVQKQQLTRELRIEREASFHQRQFMGMVAHEFRTPLSVIQAALDNLRLCSPEPAHRPRLDRMQRATTRLVQLTDNCLADARLSSSALHVDKQNADLLSVIRMAATVVELSANHFLTITLAGNRVDSTTRSPPLFADSALLCIALANLLDNAVKYTPTGEIAIAIRPQAERCEIAIRDHGPGIALDHVDQIFERYRRGVARTATPAGTGLGLYVARQIIQAHGGELWLAVNGPTGCEFTLTLPQGAPPQQKGKS